MDIWIENEYPIISELEDPWRTHFGVIPQYTHINERRRPIIDCGTNTDGSMRLHDDPCVETMLWRAPGVTAWVSGSWACWGEQDQETEGDESLHVVVFTAEEPTEKQLDDFFEALRMDVDTGEGEGVVLDYAFITRRDDSEVFYIATFGTGSAQKHRLMPQDGITECTREHFEDVQPCRKLHVEKLGPGLYAVTDNGKA